MQIKKTVLYRGVVILLFVVLLFIKLFFSNSNEPSDFSQTESISSEHNYPLKSQPEIFANDTDKTNKIPGNDFLALVDFWQVSFPKRNIEADFDSLMSVSDFISIYQPMAEQGDLTARYLITVLVWNCLGVEDEYSQHERKASNGNNSKFNSMYSALYNDYQRCEDFLSSFSTEDRRKFVDKYQYFAYEFLEPDSALDFANPNAFPIDENKMNFYSNFNMGTTGNLTKPIDKKSAIIIEFFGKAKDPVSLYSTFTLLSNTGFEDGYKPYIQELTAWFIATCSSGYGCKNNFPNIGGDKIFCTNMNVDCYNKTPKEIVSELIPGANYDEILARAWTISERIVNEEQELLILELLSTMSPENAQKYKEFQKDELMVENE